jgi:hypothetical protein
MVKAIKQELVVQKDNLIEIYSRALKPGLHVEVILLDLLGKEKGSFSSIEEADHFIRGERDQWD